MRLEELLNQYSDRLSENDLYIWDYVEKHKKQCENMTIEELARKCNVSRTTVLRFTKKLSLKGFGEFKVHLKMENDDKKQDTSKAVKVCLAYEEMMQDMVQQDFREISKLVYQAKRIFVYGTGMVQKIVAKEFKRLFYFTDKRFYDFSGVTEYETVVKYIDSDDLVLIISVSGEADSTIDFAKKVRIKGTPIISITKQKKNPLAEISNYNLYISTTIVEQNMYKGRYESMTSYYILAEILYEEKDMDRNANSFIANIRRFEDMDMDKVCQMIESASRIYTQGSGSTQKLAAQHLKEKFLYQGIFINTIEGASEYELLSEKFTEDDLVIFYSLSGQNEKQIRKMRSAKERGAKIIGIAMHGKGEFYDLADEVLTFQSEEIHTIGYGFLYYPTLHFHIVNEFLTLKYMEHQLKKQETITENNEEKH